LAAYGINSTRLLGVLDPEFALIGCKAIDRALVERPLFPVAGFMHRELDGRRALLKTSTIRDAMNVPPQLAL
jgi:hypothetical protein